MLAALVKDVLINSHTGDKLTFIKNTGDTKEDILVMETICKPARKFAPEHYHPYQEERFEIITGSLRTKINGVIRDYTAGEVFIVPASSPHAMYNASSADVHFNWQVKPALQTETFFRRLYQSINSAKAKNGSPAMKDMLAILRDFQREFVLSKIPLSLQKVIFKVISLLKRRN